MNIMRPVALRLAPEEPRQLKRGRKRANPSRTEWSRWRFGVFRVEVPAPLLDFYLAKLGK